MRPGDAESRRNAVYERRIPEQLGPLSRDATRARDSRERNVCPGETKSGSSDQWIRGTVVGLFPTPRDSAAQQEKRSSSGRSGPLKYSVPDKFVSSGRKLANVISNSNSLDEWNSIDPVRRSAERSGSGAPREIGLAIRPRLGTTRVLAGWRFFAFFRRCHLVIKTDGIFATAGGNS